MPQQLLIVRPAMPDDADRVGQLAHQFADYLRSLGDMTDFAFDAQAYLRDGFGSRPLFLGIVVETESQIIGYLLYYAGYDTDRAVKLLHVADLYVDERFRGRGAGRALMAEAAAIGRREGASGLIWSVFSPNKAAAEFYKRIGATYVMELDWMYLDIASG